MSKPKQPAAFSPLLVKDPHPTLIVTARAEVLATNASADALLNKAQLDTPGQLLPVNAAALVKSALDQGRAIENVESRFSGTICLWCFIPDQDSQQVLVRGREATQDIITREEALRSSRLYRLITENTTDLIDRKSTRLNSSHVRISYAVF